MRGGAVMEPSRDRFFKAIVVNLLAVIAVAQVIQCARALAP
jgi:hypothetical protein